MLVVDPSTDIYYRWLFVISIAVLYNVLMVIARSVFWKLHEGGLLAIWLFFDYVCDFIYLLDMAVQFRTGEWNKRHHDDDGGRCNLYGVCVCVCVRVRACVRLCMRVSVRMRVFFVVSIIRTYYIRTHARTHKYIHTYIHTFIHACMHTYIHCIHTHSRTHTHARTYIRTHSRSPIREHIHTRMYFNWCDTR